MSGRSRWAAVPALGVALMITYNVAVGTPEAIFWVCNVCVTTLLAAIVVDRPVWAKAASLWLLVGAPFWFLDTLVTHDWLPHSFITHLICPVVGLGFVRTRPAVSGAWWRADTLLIGATLVSRYATPYTLNINNSQHIAGPLGEPFSNYWLFFLAHAAVFGAVLYGLERALDLTVLRRRHA